MIVLIIALFLTSAPAEAVSNYEAEVSKLERNSVKIDEKLKSFAYFTRSSQTATKESDSEQSQKSLLHTCGDMSQLRAPVGKSLIGYTVNQLVVGPEGSPAKVELGDDQGMFSGIYILGRAKQGAREDRLLIDFDQLVFRSGRVIPIKATAMDDVGAYGLRAQIFSSKALMVVGSIAGSFISGYAASKTGYSSTSLGFNQTPTAGKSTTFQSVGQTAAEQSKKMIEDTTKEKPVLIVDSKTRVQVYLEEQISF